jgi:uncharacterized membrane protein YvbJ
MFCAKCGKELPEGSSSCPACGFSTSAASKSLSIEELISETRRAVRNLSKTAERASEKVIAGAGAAARDPKGTTKRAVRRAAKELQSAVDDLDRLLKRL